MVLTIGNEIVKNLLSVFKVDSCAEGADEQCVVSVGIWNI